MIGERMPMRRRRVRILAELTLLASKQLVRAAVIRNNLALTLTRRVWPREKGYTKDYYVRRHVVSLHVGTATDAPVTCHFRFQSGDVETVVVGKTQALGDAFTTVAARNGTPVGALRFIFDGQRLEETSTPANEELDDDEEMIIDAFTEMVGGRTVSVNSTHSRTESMKP